MVSIIKHLNQDSCHVSKKKKRRNSIYFDDDNNKDDEKNKFKNSICKR